jgi:integrase
MIDSLSIGDAGQVTSLNGYTFDPTSRTWQISRDNLICLSWIDDFLSPRLQASYLCVLTHYARTYSGGYVTNLNGSFRRFSQFTFSNCGLIDRISADDLINYRVALEREYEWYLGSMRGLLKSWERLGYSGVDQGVVSLLYSWRLRGNIKGRAVQILCPENGPLSDFEFEALHQILADAFESGNIVLEDFVLVQLLTATGRRPAQIGDLKAKDLIEATSGDGLREFILNVPRRKQQGTHWRKSFKPFALSPEIGFAVKGLIEQNRIQILSQCSDLCVTLLDELPVFPAWIALNKQAETESQLSIKAILLTQQCHRSTHDLRSQLNEIISMLAVPSERTEGNLRIFPTRLRRTMATRAAREGFGELVIAELLDHTDTQNARVYTENVPEHVDAINEAVARQLAPLAQAFSGVLVDREADARRGDDLSSRIRSESGHVGTCGHYGFCGALAPIACYTCRNFQPWLGGPHEDVLHSLVAEREKIIQVTNDKTMAAINDRTILAVTQVVQCCEARREDLSQGACID